MSGLTDAEKARPIRSYWWVKVHGDLHQVPAQWTGVSWNVLSPVHGWKSMKDSDLAKIGDQIEPSGEDAP